MARGMRGAGCGARTVAGCGPVAREVGGAGRGTRGRAGGLPRSDVAVHPLRGRQNELCDVSKPLLPASARVESTVIGVCPGRQLPSLRLPRFQQRATRPIDHQLGGLLHAAAEKNCHPFFPPSGTHVTSPKVSRNEKRRAPEIGTRLIGLPCARSVAFASTHSRTPPSPLGGLVR